MMLEYETRVLDRELSIVYINSSFQLCPVEWQNRIILRPLVYLGYLSSLRPFLLDDYGGNRTMPYFDILICFYNEVVIRQCQHFDISAGFPFGGNVTCQNQAYQIDIYCGDNRVGLMFDKCECIIYFLGKYHCMILPLQYEKISIFYHEQADTTLFK